MALHNKRLQVFVGERIRELRRSHGFSLESLAEAIGVSTGELDDYEHGRKRPTSGCLWELAETFGIPLSSFFNGLSGRKPQDGAIGFH